MSNRNSNARFDLAPNVSIQRSTFNRPFDVKTSFNVGQVIPFYVDEVLPGDTFEISTSKVARLQTLITPVMDNLYLDTYYFFVPNRLVWDHWREFCGENTQSAWYSSVEYSVPQVTSPSETGWTTGSIADYMGIPVGVPNLSVTALPFRAYALIMNEWFRDENLSDPLLIPTGDATVPGSNGDNYRSDVAAGGKPFVAAKYHDYFTSALPQPQRGPEVTLPLSGYAPVVTWHDVDKDTFPAWPQMFPSDEVVPLRFGTTAHGEPLQSSRTLVTGVSEFENPNLHISSATGTSSQVSSSRAYPMNLWADIGLTNSVSINTLRQAFQIQRFLELNARSGSRYIEILLAHFGVESPDARLQRPEYLGGNRVPLDVTQVTQTSSTDAMSPIASQAAFSQTVDTSGDVRKSFVEHGYVIGLCVARYDHTYQQGLDRMWSRTGRFDFYWPAFAHLGEQAVLNKEIFCSGNETLDNEVFGYQEAWAEYRYKPNLVTGQMRSSFQGSLDVWHFADDYAMTPALSDSWIREDPNNIDRTLAVQTSSGADQIFADILVSNRVTRPMPLYSIPGMIDHF